MDNVEKMYAYVVEYNGETKRFEFLLHAHRFYDECVEKYGVNKCCLYKETITRKVIR